MKKRIAGVLSIILVSLLIMSMVGGEAVAPKVVADNFIGNINMYRTGNKSLFETGGGTDAKASHITSFDDFKSGETFCAIMTTLPLFESPHTNYAFQSRVIFNNDKSYQYAAINNDKAMYEQSASTDNIYDWTTVNLNGQGEGYGYKHNVLYGTLRAQEFFGTDVSSVGNYASAVWLFTCHGSGKDRYYTIQSLSNIVGANGVNKGHLIVSENKDEVFEGNRLVCVNEDYSGVNAHWKMEKVSDDLCNTPHSVRLYNDTAENGDRTPIGKKLYFTASKRGAEEERFVAKEGPTEGVAWDNVIQIYPLFQGQVQTTYGYYESAFTSTLSNRYNGYNFCIPHTKNTETVTIGGDTITTDICHPLDVTHWYDYLNDGKERTAYAMYNGYFPWNHEDGLLEFLEWTTERGRGGVNTWPPDTQDSIIRWMYSTTGDNPEYKKSDGSIVDKTTAKGGISFEYNRGQLLQFVPLTKEKDPKHRSTCMWRIESTGGDIKVLDVVNFTNEEGNALHACTPIKHLDNEQNFNQQFWLLYDFSGSFYITCPGYVDMKTDDEGIQKIDDLSRKYHKQFCIFGETHSDTHDQEDNDKNNITEAFPTLPSRLHGSNREDEKFRWYFTPFSVDTTFETYIIDSNANILEANPLATLEGNEIITVGIDKNQNGKADKGEYDETKYKQYDADDNYTLFVSKSHVIKEKVTDDILSISNGRIYFIKKYDIMDKGVTSIKPTSYEMDFVGGSAGKYILNNYGNKQEADYDSRAVEAILHKYDVPRDNNGEPTSSTPKCIYYHNIKYVVPPVPTKEGYECFVGLHEGYYIAGREAKDTEVQYISDEEYTEDEYLKIEKKTFYSKTVNSYSYTNKTTYKRYLQPIWYKIEYYGNEETAGETETSWHFYNEPKNLTPNGFEKLYKVVFDPKGGNNVSYSNIATLYPALDTSKLEANEVLYKQTLLEKGGSALGGENYFYYVYKFVGWKYDQNSNSLNFENKAEILNLTTENGKIFKLYAHWAPVVGEMNFKPTTKDNCVFLGWSKESNTLNPTFETSVKNIHADQKFYAYYMGVSGGNNAIVKNADAAVPSRYELEDFADGPLPANDRYGYGNGVYAEFQVSIEKINSVSVAWYVSNNDDLSDAKQIINGGTTVIGSAEVSIDIPNGANVKSTLTIKNPTKADSGLYFFCRLKKGDLVVESNPCRLDVANNIVYHKVSKEGEVQGRIQEDWVVYGTDYTISSDKFGTGGQIKYDTYISSPVDFKQNGTSLGNRGYTLLGAQKYGNKPTDPPFEGWILFEETIRNNNNPTLDVYREKYNAFINACLNSGNYDRDIYKYIKHESGKGHSNWTLPASMPFTMDGDRTTILHDTTINLYTKWKIGVKTMQPKVTIFVDKFGTSVMAAKVEVDGKSYDFYQGNDGKNEFIKDKVYIAIVPESEDVTLNPGGEIQYSTDGMQNWKDDLTTIMGVGNWSRSTDKDVLAIVSGWYAKAGYPEYVAPIDSLQLNLNKLISVFGASDGKGGMSKELKLDFRYVAAATVDGSWFDFSASAVCGSITLVPYQYHNLG